MTDSDPDADLLLADRLVAGDADLAAATPPPGELSDTVAQRWQALAGVLQRLRNVAPPVPIPGAARLYSALLAGGNEHVPHAPERSETARPERIAGYEILRELGRGGMGVVYLARQPALDRHVAVKVLRNDASDPERAARFDREAAAVARLRHPNVVAVYDRGATDQGSYLSMEYVPGGTLADRLEAGPLPPTAAAAVVRQVALGLDAAHQAGIVHRDLKPANVLLGADEVPKVADFGLAKRLDAPGAHTRTGVIVGTPSYMAPEQARGSANVGPSADAYAIGAVLYECLTGRPPFAAAALADTLVQVCHRDPVPPRRLNPSVPRDLDTIARKCLEKEPHRRYPSAVAVAEGLERFLAGKPIHARRTTWVTQAGKWARRQPVMAALVLALLVAASASLVVWYRFTIRLGEARTQTAEERDKAVANLAVARRAVRQFLSETTNDAHFKIAAAPQLGRKLLELSRTAYADMSAATSDDPDLLFDYVGAMTDLARMMRLLGDDAEATALLREAASASERLAERAGDRTNLLFHVAGARNSVAFDLAGRNKLPEAIAAYRESLALFERLDRFAPNDAQYRFNQSHVLNNLASALRRSKDLAGAEQAHRQALALRRSLDQSTPDHANAVAQSLHGLGTVAMEAGRMEDAEGYYRDAVSRREALYATKSEYPEYAVAVASSLESLGDLYRRAKRPEKAVPCYASAAEVLSALTARHPGVAGYETTLKRVTSKHAAVLGQK